MSDQTNGDNQRSSFRKRTLQELHGDGKVLGFDELTVLHDGHAILKEIVTCPSCKRLGYGSKKTLEVHSIAVPTCINK